MRNSQIFKRVFCSFLLLLFVAGCTLPMAKVRADFDEEMKGPSCWIDVAVEDGEHIYEAMSSIDDSGRICRGVSLTPYFPGETVTFSIMVGNNGTENLENILVTDELLGLCETVACLAPGETEEFYASYVMTEEDALRGFVRNLASAQVTLPPAEEGAEAEIIREEDADEVPAFLANPSVAISYQMLSEPANGEAYSDGEQAQYIIRVHNNGNVTLENLLVFDEKADYAFILGLLEADEVCEEEMFLYVLGEEAEEGIFRNTVTVSCENPCNPASGELSASLVMELPAEAAEEDEYTEEETEEEEAEAEESAETETEEAAEETEAETEVEETEAGLEESAEAEGKKEETADSEASEEPESDEAADPDAEDETQTLREETDIAETLAEPDEEKDETAVILPEPYTEEELVLGDYEEPGFTEEEQTEAKEAGSTVFPEVDWREGIAAGLYISHNEVANVPVRSARMVAASSNSPVSGMVVSNHTPSPEMGDTATLLAPFASLVVSALGLGLVWKKKS